MKGENLKCKIFYTLHSMILAANRQLPELTGVTSALIEAPMVSQGDFCTAMFNMTNMLLKYVKHVAVIVQPTIRRVVQRTDWITSWNEKEKAAFRFVRCCS